MSVINLKIRQIGIFSFTLPHVAVFLQEIPFCRKGKYRILLLIEYVKGRVSNLYFTDSPTNVLSDVANGIALYSFSKKLS